MSIRTGLLFAFLLALTAQSFAQVISKEYQKNCVLEQVAEHQGVKGKALTDVDFVNYCSCQAEYVSKNASNRQANELLMNPKAKPEWLKAIEFNAMKACIAIDSKLST